ncbi:MAG: ParA family protein [Caulobacter sp.]|nr:ParA family protein [Caulobacter sp.]
MKTVVVTSRKGGVGKTTVAVNLALAAFAAGSRVLLADTDPQRSATDALKARTRPGPSLVETTAGKLFQLHMAASREGVDLLVIDTPSTPEADVALAMNIADLCVLVSRPNFLDVASVVRSSEAVRRLGRTGVVVLNQAPPSRKGVEPPAVLRAIEALRFGGLPLASVGLRSRAVYQAAIAHGVSVAEWDPASTAAREIAGLWRDLERRLGEHRTAERA